MTASGTHAPRRPLQVLVVDDDRLQREALGAALEQAGNSVTLAGSVAEARSVLVRRLPDVVISDIAMPDEDGFSLIRVLREIQAELGQPVVAIAITGLGSPDIRRRAVRAGFDACFIKPIDLVAVMSRLERLLLGGSAW
jgi:CheY-like chemotaxis protein